MKRLSFTLFATLDCRRKSNCYGLLLVICIASTHIDPVEDLFVVLASLGQQLPERAADVLQGELSALGHSR